MDLVSLGNDLKLVSLPCTTHLHQRELWEIHSSEQQRKQFGNSFKPMSGCILLKGWVYPNHVRTDGVFITENSILRQMTLHAS